MKKYSYQTDEPIGPNEGRIRRNVKAKHDLHGTLPFEIQTLWDFVPYVAKKYGPKRAVGSRTILGTITSEPSVSNTNNKAAMANALRNKTQKFELSPFEYINFTELSLIIQTLGSGLSTVGLKQKDRIQIYARTSARWLTTALAAASQNLTITTAYDTLGEDGLIHCLKQTQARACYTEADLLPNLYIILPHTPDLELIIYSGDPDADVLDQIRLKFPHVSIYNYDEIIRLGRENFGEPNPPEPEDIACIMYTSGSTGPPKGVLITHEQIVAAIDGFDAHVGDQVRPHDYMLCFLPLAHILEFLFEIVALYWGTTLGYANIRTLTDANVYNCKGDIAEFSPTIMFGVPAVWEMVRKGILNQLQHSNAFKRGMFWSAYYTKIGLKKAHLPGSALLDALVFRKVRQATGGRLRYVLSGGAHLAETTRKFITITLCPILIGYGLTETCATAALTHPGEYTPGTIGPPLPCIEMKLVDVPEAGYYASNPVGDREQGEIYVRGKSVTRGYFMNEEENREAFVDGWFKTGDIGEWCPNGHIRIIDRRKNLVKTLIGEYIALEKLESIYRTCHLVNNVCVYAVPTKRRPIAIVVPNEYNLRKYALQHGMIESEDEQWNKICTNPKVIQAVWHSMLEVGQISKLRGIELIQGIVLCTEEFTVENGLVTSTQKLQRRVIAEAYKKEIEKAFAMLPS